MQNIEEKYASQRSQIMEAVLSLLPFHNWDEKLLLEAEQKCGFSAGYYYVLFPEGINEVVDFFESWQDELALKAISSQALPKKIRDKVGLFLKQRIRQLAPLIHTKTGSFFASPDKLILGNKIAWRTCDRIWQYAGDTSTDYNHHTKRALLLSVYISAVMFFIADTSEDHKETDEFIVKSLDNIVNIATIARNFKMPEMADLPIFRMFS